MSIRATCGNPFLKETLEPSERWKAEVSQRHPYRLSSTLKSFATEVVFGRTDCTVQTLGYRWVLERRAKSGTSYQRVRRDVSETFQTMHYSCWILALMKAP